MSSRRSEPQSELSDQRNFAAEGADPPPPDLRPVSVGLREPSRGAPYDRVADCLGDPVLRRAPSGGAGYPEGKKTERSEGPEILRYIARSQATVRAVQIGGARAFDAHLSSESRNPGRRRGGLPVIVRECGFAPLRR